MQFKSTILAILSGAAMSAALAVDVRVTTEMRKQPEWAIAHPRITTEMRKQPKWAIAQHPISILGQVDPVTNCGGGGTLGSLLVQNCEGAPPCSINANTDTTIEINWIPFQSFASATLNIYAETSLGKAPLSSPSLCDLQDCPGLGGQLYSPGPILSITPALSGQDIVLVMEINDDGSGRTLLCVSIPVHVN